MGVNDNMLVGWLQITRKLRIRVTSVALLGLPLWLFSSGTARADEIDAFVAREMQTRNIPGVAIGIIDHGQITKRVYGVANLEMETQVRTDSVFEIASVTKPFTAMAVMQLVEEGKVHLDDPITNFIERTPPAWKNITVRQLLSHTSGTRGGGWVERDGSPLLDITTREQFEDIVRSPLLFGPGEGAAYSDPGYFLLGMVIEKASGLRYSAFMQQRVFAPAGMSSSRILDRREIVKGHVSCYTLRDGRIENGRRVWQHELPSYYGMASTVEDLIRWDLALGQGALLKTNILALMWTPAKLSNGQLAQVDGQPYGLGWFIQDLNGHRIIGHPGFLGSMFLRFLDDGLTIIVLTNLDAESGSPHIKLAFGLASRLRPQFAPMFARYL